jgi:hypothetical protein
MSERDGTRARLVSDTECDHRCVESDLDILIHEKMSQLADAFAAHQRSIEAVAQARTCLAELAREIQRLESEERDAATRFNAISEELVGLHRRKHGDWHIVWGGSRYPL